MTTSASAPHQRSAGNAVPSQPVHARGAARSSASAGAGAGAAAGAGASSRAGSIAGDPPPSTVTRHLSAGAYLDEDFCRVAMAEVYDQGRRLVAPSYGFDLVTVLAHCRRARASYLVRDGSLVVAIATAGWVSPRGTVVALSALAQIHVAVAGWRLMRDTTHQRRTGVALRASALIARAVTASVGLLLAIAAGAASYAALLAPAAIAPLGIAPLGIAPAGIAPLGIAPIGTEPVGTGDVLFGASVLDAVILSILVGANLWRQRQLAGLAPGRAAKAAAMTARLTSIGQQQGANATVYSGRRPFLGSGQELGGWGLAVRLTRPGDVSEAAATQSDQEVGAAAFTAQELIDHVREQLRQLSTHAVPELAIPGLTVEDHVFIAGTEMSYLTPFLHPIFVRRVIRNPTPAARHYLACRHLAWKGELVTTVYLHVAVRGGTLVVELSGWVSPPCDDRFRVVDDVRGTGVVAYLRALGRAIVDAPSTVASTPANLVRAGFGAVAAVRGLAVGTGVTPGYDYGARVSIRELATSAGPATQVRTYRAATYRRMVERRVAAAIQDFLAAKGVDTAEYHERLMSILSRSTETGQRAVD